MGTQLSSSTDTVPRALSSCHSRGIIYASDSGTLTICILQLGTGGLKCAITPQLILLLGASRRLLGKLKTQWKFLFPNVFVLFKWSCGTYPTRSHQNVTFCARSNEKMLLLNGYQREKANLLILKKTQNEDIQTMTLCSST